MARWLRKIAFSVCVVVILLPLAGASYQAIESRLDARHFPENGRLVDVGGYRLMLNCTGVGNPTVILEAGFGDVSVEWRAVQPQIAKFSRVCSYDRAGYGGSDPGPVPRTSLQIATELHALLRNAGEMPPYVLVGHSFGGYNVRVFNGLYPDEVAGMCWPTLHKKTNMNCSRRRGVQSARRNCSTASARQGMLSSLSTSALAA